MKKLPTISAVVFLMVFTAGLASAKTPALSFPFMATGDLVSVTDGGTTGGPVSATITVHEVSGLFWGTIVLETSPTITTIDFSAVKDLSGVYSFNGVVVGTTPANIPVQGAFVISIHKVPVLNTKVNAAAIEFGTLATSTAGPAVSAGESFAGLLIHIQ